MSKTKIWRAWCAKNRVHVLDDRVIIGNMIDGKLVYDANFGHTYTVLFNSDEPGQEFFYPEAAISLAETYVKGLLERIESKNERGNVANAIMRVLHHAQTI